MNQSRLATLIICIGLITLWAQCSHADYVLQVVKRNGEIVTVDCYRGDDETKCLRDYYAYKAGAKRYPDTIDAYGGGCIPCDEFPKLCQEGI